MKTKKNPCTNTSAHHGYKNINKVNKNRETDESISLNDDT